MRPAILAWIFPELDASSKLCGGNSIEKDVSLLRLLQNAVQLSDVLYLLRRELGDACDEIERHFLL